MPTVTPLPSTPKLARALAAFSCASPSDLTAPPQSAPRTSGASTSVTPAPPRPPRRCGEVGGPGRDRHRLVAAAGWTISRPRRRAGPRAPATAPASKRTSARTRLPSRSRLPGPLAARLSRAACVLPAKPSAAAGWRARPAAARGSGSAAARHRHCRRGGRARPGGAGRGERAHAVAAGRPRECSRGSSAAKYRHGGDSPETRLGRDSERWRESARDHARSEPGRTGMPNLRRRGRRSCYGPLR